MEENQESPIQPVADQKKSEPNYKLALKYALAVIVLLIIIVAINMLFAKGGVYKSGYVDGWNGCRAAQIDLLQKANIQPDLGVDIVAPEVIVPEPQIDILGGQ
jgi:hypothetical protein